MQLGFRLLLLKRQREKIARYVGGVMTFGLFVAVEYSSDQIAQFSDADMFIAQPVSMNGSGQAEKQPAPSVERGSTHMKDLTGKFLQKGDQFGSENMQKSWLGVC